MLIPYLVSCLNCILTGVTFILAQKRQRSENRCPKENLLHQIFQLRDGLYSYRLTN